VRHILINYDVTLNRFHYEGDKKRFFLSLTDLGKSSDETAGFVPLGTLTFYQHSATQSDHVEK
jgi:hypothetical protein